MSKSERHSGELKSTGHIAEGFFEFGGHRLPLDGTSGPPKEQPRVAEGKPIRAGATERGPDPEAVATSFDFGGSKLQVSGTSGPAKELPRFAEGTPNRHGTSDREPVAREGSTGSGHLTGGPTRRS